MDVVGVETPIHRVSNLRLTVILEMITSGKVYLPHIGVN